VLQVKENKGRTGGREQTALPRPTTTKKNSGRTMRRRDREMHHARPSLYRKTVYTYTNLPSTVLPPEMPTRQPLAACRAFNAMRTRTEDHNTPPSPSSTRLSSHHGDNDDGQPRHIATAVHPLRINTGNRRGRVSIRNAHRQTPFLPRLFSFSCFFLSFPSLLPSRASQYVTRRQATPRQSVDSRQA